MLALSSEWLPTLTEIATKSSFLHLLICMQPLPVVPQALNRTPGLLSDEVTGMKCYSLNQSLWPGEGSTLTGSDPG